MTDVSNVRELANAAAKAREWTVRRDELIRAQLRRGVTLRAIAEVVDLSHTAIMKIGKRPVKKAKKEKRP